MSRKKTMAMDMVACDLLVLDQDGIENTWPANLAMRYSINDPLTVCFNVISPDESCQCLGRVAFDRSLLYASEHTTKSLSLTVRGEYLIIRSSNCGSSIAFRVKVSAAVKFRQQCEQVLCIEDVEGKQAEAFDREFAAVVEGWL